MSVNISELEAAEAAAVECMTHGSFRMDPPSAVTVSEHLASIITVFSDMKSSVRNITRWYCPEVIACSDEFLGVLDCVPNFKRPSARIEKGKIIFALGSLGPFRVFIDDSFSFTDVALRYRPNGPDVARLELQNYDLYYSRYLSPIEKILDAIFIGCPQLKMSMEDTRLFSFCPRCGSPIGNIKDNIITCESCCFMMDVVVEGDI